jgi:predicted ATPase
MVAKLSRLPPATQKVLGQLACLGNAAESETLALVHEASDEATNAALLLTRSQNLSRSVVRLIEASRQFGQAETNDMQLNPNLTCAISKGSRQ